MTTTVESMAMLRIENLRKSFGGVVATNNLSLEFQKDSLTAVIGPNGAGKTTIFNLVSGALKPDSGRILLEGNDIAGLQPVDIVRLGIGRAFQVSNLFKSLTVEESLRGALMSPLGRSFQMTDRFPLEATRDRAYEVMDQLGLTRQAGTISGNLSHGDQKLLDIALALALEPKVILLDEPVAGMGPEERHQMIDTIYRLWQKGGLTLVLIEHDMDIVFRISQKIFVLTYGSLLASGTADEIRTNPEVIKAYLGAPEGGFV